MHRHGVALVLAAVVTIAGGSACRAGPDGAWDEDLRRCLVSKPIEGGRVVLAHDDGFVEIDVQRGRDADAGTYRVAFDGRPPIDTTPPEGASGLYDHRLGRFADVAPLFGRARTMRIVVSAAGRPTETITVQIGNGRKAMAFLKSCSDYWKRRNSRTR